MRPRPTRALALAALLLPRAGRCLDAEVRAETVTQGYQVRGPSGAPVLSMRRITQTLSLGASQRVDEGHGPYITLQARLRIDSDFGTACDPQTDRCLDELNRSRAAEFAPLYTRRTLDLPFAWVDVEGLWHRRVDLRAGRQFVVDSLGFLLFDGAMARLHIGPYVALEAYGGLETRAGFPLSNGRYERDGLIRADRAGWDASVAPQVLDAATAPLMGAALELRGLGPVDARVTWRRVLSEGSVVEEKVGGRIAWQIARRWLAVTEGVWSVPQETVSLASMAVEWRGRAGTMVGVELLRSRPVFDLTSIWASFWVDPVDDARVHAERRLSESVVLTGDLHARRYALSNTPRDDGTTLPDLWAGGGGASLAVRTRRLEGSLRVQGEYGAVGERAGADLLAKWWIRPQRVRIDVGASVWGVSDVYRPQRDVVTLGLTAGMLVRLGRIAQVQLGVEEDLNRIVGARFRAVAMLDLRSPL